MKWYKKWPQQSAGAPDAFDIGRGRMNDELNDEVAYDYATGGSAPVNLALARLHNRPTTGDNVSQPSSKLAS